MIILQTVGPRVRVPVNYTCALYASLCLVQRGLTGDGVWVLAWHFFWGGEVSGGACPWVDVGR
jgi:hypothetical protein